MYKVYYKTVYSPEELETWLNEMKDKENLILIGVDNGYYIFIKLPTYNINYDKGGIIYTEN